MHITFLGTSSGAPSLSRNMAGVAIRLSQQSTLWLFDCGEGTQHQAMRARVRLSHLERIFITHLHGDHLFGLPGLLASRSQQTSISQSLALYGPAGLEEFVRTALRVSETALSYPLEFITVAPKEVLDYRGVKVTCARTNHRIESYAYAVQEPDFPGRFDAERALALGIPFGPLYGKLKSGAIVTLPDGRIIEGTSLVGPARKGRRVVFSGDTRYSPDVVNLAAGADVLIHEATYVGADAALADRAAHSTAAIAAQVANDAEVKTLILTHFSARYEGSGGSRMKEFLEEARQVFPNTFLAEDMSTYQLPSVTD